MEEKEPNLIQKAVVRVANKLHGSKIFKRVGALVIVAALSATLSACDCNNITPPPGPSTSYVCDDCGGNHRTEDHTKQTEVGYSVLLHSVEEDPYYQSIVDQVNKTRDPESNGLKRKNCYLLNQHPYGFLQDQGYDVEAIKNGQLSCQTFSFVRADQPNKLYMVTRVLTEDNGWYNYVNYMISYDLTKQEMADYKGTYAQQYIYANFLNDAISKQKKATIHMQTVSRKTPTLKLFDYAKKTGTLNEYKPFKDVGEVVYVSCEEGGPGENSVTIIGFTPTQAHYVTLEDGRYASFTTTGIFDGVGNAAAECVKGEAKVYDIQYFNKTWIDCADAEYWAGTRNGGYCCGTMTYNPELNK